MKGVTGGPRFSYNDSGLKTSKLFTHHHRATPKLNVKESLITGTRRKVHESTVEIRNNFIDKFRKRTKNNLTNKRITTQNSQEHIRSIFQ